MPETTEVEDALDPLELELQTIVGFHVGAGNQSSARMVSALTTEQALQPQFFGSLEQKYRLYNKKCISVLWILILEEKSGEGGQVKQLLRKPQQIKRGANRSFLQLEGKKDHSRRMAAILSLRERRWACTSPHVTDLQDWGQGPHFPTKHRLASSQAVQPQDKLGS